MTLDNFLANFSYRRSRHRQQCHEAIKQEMERLYYRSTFVVSYLDDQSDEEIMNTIKQKRAEKNKEMMDAFHSCLFGWLVNKEVENHLLRDFLGFISEHSLGDAVQLNAAIKVLLDLLDEEEDKAEIDEDEEELPSEQQEMIRVLIADATLRIEENKKQKDKQMIKMMEDSIREVGFPPE